MNAEFDAAGDTRPPLFLRLSNEARRLDALVTPNDDGQMRLSGVWRVEVTTPGGQRTARPITFKDDASTSENYALAARILGDGIDPMQLWDPPVASVDPLSDTFDLLRLKAWEEADEASLPTEEAAGKWERTGTYPYAFWHNGQRTFAQVATDDHSCITAVDPDSSFWIEFLEIADGRMPTVRVEPRKDLPTAYRSFIRHGDHEAAYAVGKRMLAMIEAAGPDETIAARVLVAAAEATLRFPEIRKWEGRFAELLSRRSEECVDLEALAWARRFDSDPAPSEVFEEEFDSLVRRLLEEPPRCSGTVRALFQRFGTALDIREDLAAHPNPSARLAGRQIRRLASAVLWDRDELTFEGWSPLAPQRTARPALATAPAAAAKTDPSPGLASF